MDGPLSSAELDDLTSSQRDTYREAVRSVQGSDWLGTAGIGQPWGRTFGQNWKEEFGEALGFLFFLGSVVIFPVALLITSALAEQMRFSNDSMGPAVAVYIALLLALAALKASISADQPPPRTSVEQLRAERLAQLHGHWRGVAGEQQKRRVQQSGRSGAVQKGTAASRSTSSQARPSPVPQQSPNTGGKEPTGRENPGPRPGKSPNSASVPARGTSGGSISSGNRSIPGGTFTPWISAEQKLAIAGRYRWICQLCLRPIDRNISHDYEGPDPDRLVIDHIKPRKHGGTDNPSNLQPTHHRCNMKKGDKWITNEEFRKWEAIRAEHKARRQSSAHAQHGGPDSAERFPTNTSRWSRSDSPSPNLTRTSASRATSRLGNTHSHSEPKYSRPPAHPTVRRLRDELSTAELSPLMRERAARFLDEDHPAGLRTECQRGHDFTLENTYFRIKDGEIGRQCRECIRLRDE